MCSKCLLDTHDCSDNSICINTPGGFSCDCIVGFELIGRNTCIDINECLTNTHNCHQQCNNTVGNFKCSCYDGFFLNNDNTCSSKYANCEFICIPSHVFQILMSVPMIMGAVFSLALTQWALFPAAVIQDSHSVEMALVHVLMVFPPEEPFVMVLYIKIEQ